MRALPFVIVLLLQSPPAPQPAGIRVILAQLVAQFEQHNLTFGAAAELTTAKHQMRDWVESQLADAGQNVDTRSFAETLHAALRGAELLCTDCDWNVLGYVDDVRVSRDAEFLVIVTAMGLSCGYDESAYVYGWTGQQWRRLWEQERNVYTRAEYLPQAIHDVQVSEPDANGSRLVMTLGSETTCGGSFKNVYARAWRMDRDLRFEQVLDRAAYANDNYPPIRGRVLSDGAIITFSAGGELSGDSHTAVRHFKIDGNTSTQVDPIAGRPRDFVVEWLTAAWDESRTHAESPSLETWHAQLHRTDNVGDFGEATRRCTTGADLWQVGMNFFEGPKRYYRVRWREPFLFSIVEVSETPFADCTIADRRGDTYPNLRDLR